MTKKESLRGETSKYGTTEMNQITPGSQKGQGRNVSNTQTSEEQEKHTKRPEQKDDTTTRKNAAQRKLLYAGAQHIAMETASQALQLFFKGQSKRTNKKTANLDNVNTSVNDFQTGEPAVYMVHLDHNEISEMLAQVGCTLERDSKDTQKAWISTSDGKQIHAELNTDAMSIRIYNKTKASLAMCHHFSNASATIAATHGVIVIPSCTVIYAPSTRLNTLIASCKAALEEGITSVTVKPSEANGVKTHKVTYPPGHLDLYGQKKLTYNVAYNQGKGKPISIVITGQNCGRIQIASILMDVVRDTAKKTTGGWAAWQKELDLVAPLDDEELAGIVEEHKDDNGPSQHKTPEKEKKTKENAQLAPCAEDEKQPKDAVAKAVRNIAVKTVLAGLRTRSTSSPGANTTSLGVATEERDALIVAAKKDALELLITAEINAWRTHLHTSNTDLIDELAKKEKEIKGYLQRIHASVKADVAMIIQNRSVDKLQATELETNLIKERLQVSLPASPSANTAQQTLLLAQGARIESAITALGAKLSEIAEDTTAIRFPEVAKQKEQQRQEELRAQQEANEAKEQAEADRKRREQEAEDERWRNESLYFYFLPKDEKTAIMVHKLALKHGCADLSKSKAAHRVRMDESTLPEFEKWLNLMSDCGTDLLIAKEENHVTGGVATLIADSQDDMDALLGTYTAIRSGMFNQPPMEKDEEEAESWNSKDEERNDGHGNQSEQKAQPGSNKAASQQPKLRVKWQDGQGEWGSEGNETGHEAEPVDCRHREFMENVLRDSYGGLGASKNEKTFALFAISNPNGPCLGYAKNASVGDTMPHVAITSENLNESAWTLVAEKYFFDQLTAPAHPGLASRPQFPATKAYKQKNRVHAFAPAHNFLSMEKPPTGRRSGAPYANYAQDVTYVPISQVIMLPLSNRPPKGEWPKLTEDNDAEVLPSDNKTFIDLVRAAYESLQPEGEEGLEHIKQDLVWWQSLMQTERPEGHPAVEAHRKRQADKEKRSLKSSSRLHPNGNRSNNHPPTQRAGPSHQRSDARAPPPLDNREGGRRMMGRGSDNGRKRQYRDDHNQWSNPRPGNKFIRTDGPSRP